MSEVKMGYWCRTHPENKRFMTTGIEYHDWVVDEQGNFLDDKGCFDAQRSEGEVECCICHEAADWVELTEGETK